MRWMLEHLGSVSALVVTVVLNPLGLQESIAVGENSRSSSEVGGCCGECLFRKIQIRKWWWIVVDSSRYHGHGVAVVVVVVGTSVTEIADIP
ncbi:hypothetical protein DFH27DRAFT_539364 [Peziza echinospora]|nr:hypothetical protein DFH27DRAFT_539364 [Peziza echinospora]